MTGRIGVKADPPGEGASASTMSKHKNSDDKTLTFFSHHDRDVNVAPLYPAHGFGKFVLVFGAAFAAPANFGSGRLGFMIACWLLR